MTTRYSTVSGGSDEQVHLMNDEEYKSPDPQSSRLNRKSLVIFFGITVVAVALVIGTVMVSLYSGKGESFPGKMVRSADKFQFQDIFSGRFSPAMYSCNWIDDNKYITSTQDGLVLVDLTEDKKVIMLDADTKEKLGIYKHWFSPDRRYILYIKDQVHQYRYSFFAEYYIYDLVTGVVIQIDPGKGEDAKKIQYATWDESGSSLAFVYKNDIFYKESPKSAVKRLTDSGVVNKIFNGIPDWVYQEEVLNSDHALYFSPKATFIAFIQFDDTKVNWYQFPWYGDKGNSYTSIRKIAYPKPGFSNPTVTVNVIHPETGNTVSLLEPVDFRKIDHYVINIAWASETAVIVTWLNRDQNKAVLHMCNLEQTSTSPYLRSICEENSVITVQNGWVDDKYQTPYFSKDGSYFITKWPFSQGGAGKFIHLAKIGTKGKTNPVAVTSGAWEVVTILAHDDKNEIIYFSATKESPTQRHIYSVKITSGELSCLTCNLATVIKGNKCSYYSASFSLGGSWYILYCRGPGIPEVTLRSTNIDKVETLEDNHALRERLDGVSLPVVESYNITSGSYDLYVKEYRPPNFDPRKKYAVLFSVYGGPASQKVVDSYGYGFETGYLVSNFDLIVVNVDARGTCCRGEKFKHEVYRHLGEYEAEDTINVAKEVAKYDYVDETKMAIWGWSYGGFLTSYVLGVNSGVFKLGMAVAPVTDWRYYDSIYTERYMLTPEKNLKGYEASSVLNKAKNFQNDSFLLVHGTGDDNVHFQNTAQLVAALTKAGVKYQVQFYPDKNHGLSGDGTSSHLYHLLTRFLVEKLSLNS
ncbi:prolyl endopeptidase FAP-like [Stylophora pistillata]|uniref:prolyl endopeptidase FAP-like n=1 Tax=Stylophora pistillata TaxID=50429 RepID=UPI000C04BE2E|nr:prolyl endopeptidase FAP-like [Stylophora pistillata]